MPRATFHVKQTFNKQLIPPLLVGTVFLAGITYFLHPFTLENTNAITERTTNGDYYLETTSTDLNLTIETTPAGNQVSSSHDVTVKTDDPAGYTLTVSVNNDTSNALNLNGNTSATEKFNATSGTYDSPKALDENSWGFADTLAKTTNNQWAAVPLLSNAQQLKSTSAANESGDTTTIHYAINAKYDGAHSNGDYSNTIVYSVTGNTIPKKDLSGSPYMHELTAENCANADTFSTSDVSDTTYEVVDARTNEKYWVRKFGNLCWMVENLYLPKGTTISTTNNYSKVNFSTYPTTDSTSGWNSTGGKSPMINTGSRRRATDSGNNDGTWMNWYTATAGTGGAYGTNKAATSDICPTNWRLPTHTENDSMSVSSIGGSISNFYANPVFPGYRINNGLTNASSGAYWWSSTQYDANVAYFLCLGAGGLDTNGNYKGYGFSVRCVLPAE